MKKILFLMILPFLLLGTASVSAQVRIGGSDSPHSSAVLDLNVNDDATPSGNQGGLALPRVELATVTMELNNTPPINGMLVYNTGGTLATGVYVWMTDKWVKASTGSVAYTDSESITLSGTEFRRAALTGDVVAEANENTTTITADAVTSAKILDKTIATADIADLAVGNSQLAANAVTTDKIQDLSVGTADLADYSVTAEKLNSSGATSGHTLVYNGDAWAPVALANILEYSVGKILEKTRGASENFKFPALVRRIPLGCNPGSSEHIEMQPVSAVMDSLMVNYVYSWDGAIVGFNGKAICGYRKPCRCLFLTFVPQ
jgi:hypothetical protein